MVPVSTSSSLCFMWAGSTANRLAFLQTHRFAKMRAIYRGEFSRGMYSGYVATAPFQSDSAVSRWGLLKSQAEEYGGQFDSDLKSVVLLFTSSLPSLQLPLNLLCCQGLGVQQWGAEYDDTESQYSGQFKNGLREGYGVLAYKVQLVLSPKFRSQFETRTVATMPGYSRLVCSTDSGGCSSHSRNLSTRARGRPGRLMLVSP